MSQLCTYYSPTDHQIKAYEGNGLAVHLNPGAWVRHDHYEGTKGMLVVNGDDFVTVLWSIVPAGSILEEMLAKQILDEIYAEILRDLEIASR